MNTFFLRAAAVGLIGLGVMLLPQQSNAQAFQKGQQSVLLGHGVGTFTGMASDVLNSGGLTGHSALGPYYAKYEKGISKRLSFGINTSLMRNQWSYVPDGAKLPGSVDESLGENKVQIQRWAYSAIGRFNVHFGKHPKFDPYAGAGIGFRSANWSVDANGQEFDGLRHIPNMPIAFEFGVGARYYILPNLGVYAEFGGAKSLLQGGLIMNLPSGNNNNGTGNTGTGNSNKGNTGGSGKGKGGKLKNK